MKKFVLGVTIMVFALAIIVPSAISAKPSSRCGLTSEIIWVNSPKTVGKTLSECDGKTYVFRFPQDVVNPDLGLEVGYKACGFDFQGHKAWNVFNHPTGARCL